MSRSALGKTTTFWVQLALLPLQSVAVQVRVIVVEPSGLGVETSTNVTVGLGSQLSVTVGAGKFGVEPHGTGEGATGHVIVGGVVSTTVMVWLQLAALPQWSVAVQVRVTL